MMSPTDNDIAGEPQEGIDGGPPGMPGTTNPASRTIIDYISGRTVRATLEEVDGVQVFARRLVEELGYPKAMVQTRPQFRVRPRPSEKSARGYPVDIVVFGATRRLEDDAYIVVECKKKSRKDGEDQLKLYLTMSSASIGVWFNGNDHLYLLKEYEPGGRIEWAVLPSLPKYGQTVGDIGHFQRKDLVTPTNLKSIFRDIRNHLVS